MEALRRREEALVDFARRERDLQLRRLREEVATCTAHLQHTTALVQFCIEAFLFQIFYRLFFFSLFILQIGSMLVNRVSNLDLTWRQEMDELTNRASPTLELTLDDLGLRRNIDQLTFQRAQRTFLEMQYLALCDYWETRRVGPPSFCSAFSA